MCCVTGLHNLNSIRYFSLCARISWWRTVSCRFFIIFRDKDLTQSSLCWWWWWWWWSVVTGWPLAWPYLSPRPSWTSIQQEDKRRDPHLALQFHTVSNCLCIQSGMTTSYAQNKQLFLFCVLFDESNSCSGNGREHPHWCYQCASKLHFRDSTTVLRSLSAYPGQ